MLFTGTCGHRQKIGILLGVNIPPDPLWFPHPSRLSQTYHLFSSSWLKWFSLPLLCTESVDKSAVVVLLACAASAMGLCDVLSAVFPTRTVCSHTLVSGSSPCSSAGLFLPFSLLLSHVYWSSGISLEYLLPSSSPGKFLIMKFYDMMYVQVILVRIKWMFYAYLFPFFPLPDNIKEAQNV